MMNDGRLNSVKNADFKDKRVIMRVDLNVPLDEDGNVRDHQRIIQILPTVNYILYNGAKQLILMSHHGRPHGKYDPTQSLKGVAKYFRDNLAFNLTFVRDYLDVPLPDDKLILLENLRFNIEEEQDDEQFAKKLASMADIYVNDAFGSYQAHASVVGMPKHLPSYFGFLFQQEIDALNLSKIERPLVFLLGGNKASTKLPMMKKIYGDADEILVGGVLPFYFLVAQGHDVGKSKFNPEYLKFANDLLEKEKIRLPTDFVAGTSTDDDTVTRVCKATELQADEMGLDIGPETLAKYKEILSKAKTIIWNGPMGLYEVERFAKHTDELAKHLTTLEATVIAGGGDSITVINKLGIYNQIDHVSTGGGATLKFLQKGTLPAIEAQKLRVKA